MRFSVQLASVILGCCSVFEAARCDTLAYTYTNLNLPGAASGINDEGQIVGNSRAGGFLYSNGQLSTIVIPGPVSSLGGINHAGQIAGSSGGLGGSNGFLYDNGVFAFFHVGSSLSTTASGINNQGQIVGSFDGRGYLYSNGRFTALDFPDASFTSLRGINDAGAIVGDFQGAGSGHGFLYSQDAFTAIDVPGASNTQVTAINDAGQIVGSFLDEDGNSHAFVDNGSEFTVLNPPNASPGATEYSATGINNAGQILGDYTDSNNNIQNFLATPVPEASSLLLGMCGLTTAGAIRRMLRTR
jgi:probable HAF family extracellular repeat protein